MKLNVYLQDRDEPVLLEAELLVPVEKEGALRVFNSDTWTTKTTVATFPKGAWAGWSVLNA